MALHATSPASWHTVRVSFERACEHAECAANACHGLMLSRIATQFAATAAQLCRVRIAAASTCSFAHSTGQTGNMRAAPGCAALRAVLLQSDPMQYAMLAGACRHLPGLGLPARKAAACSGHHLLPLQVCFCWSAIACVLLAQQACMGMPAVTHETHDQCVRPFPWWNLQHHRSVQQLKHASLISDEPSHASVARSCRHPESQLLLCVSREWAIILPTWLCVTVVAAFWAYEGCANRKLTQCLSSTSMPL